MVNYGLTDRVAIITGANNPWGIGAATALAFAREGAKVVLCRQILRCKRRNCRYRGAQAQRNACRLYDFGKRHF